MLSVTSKLPDDLNFQFCATEVDVDGIVTKLGYCGSECLSHAQVMNWKIAQTLKIILQYDNSLFETGMMVYGYLLTGVSIIGLILTTFLPATSM